MKKWHKYEIVGSEIGKVGHKFTYDFGGKKEVIRFVDVRGGWAWPTDQSPFYCVILGQIWFDEKLYYDKSAALDVLFEGTDNGLDLDRRFNELADISALYRCDWYADTGQIHEPAASSWWDFQSFKSMRYGDLDTAPWADNFRLGIELCKTFVRTHKLDVPKETEVFHQLQRITEKDLASASVKSQFYAIEALRHVVAGFKRDPADNPHIDAKGHLSGGREGWMI
jgi:hypothetical protein